MLQYSICAFLAPAAVSAFAFPWAGPEPTFVVPVEDNWSPAPTEGPRVGGAIELFKREDDNTCGYINGEYTRSLTCNNENYVCATNSYYGVHGCCDPDGISTCSLYTTCIPSSLMSASCTGDCSTNELVAKCTNSAQPYCYEWRYVYSTRTVMTEHGCADSAFTVAVQRTYDDVSGVSTSTDIPSDNPVTDRVTITVTESASESASSSTSSSASNTAQSQTASPSETGESGGGTNVGAIAGGVVGGLAALAAIAFGIVFFILRKRKQKQIADNAAHGATQPMMGPAPGVAEYKPQPGGFPSPGQPFSPQPAAADYYSQEAKPGFQQMGVPGQEMNPYSPPTSPTPQYSGPAPIQPVPFGVAEAGGSEVQPPPAQQPQGQQPGQYPAGQPPQQQQQQQQQPGHTIYEAP
ncbi:hypothetical protein CC78DRAFT_530655 [Lojkania enalia]|uniref:Mid2 domain-containing protein n=1 Tax=Lojkania enalia TaxID=147567 RepID=A0A9P4KG58_9PLEO|nr:hypothetical protein CC78DRAFT_530655 [Didymosphaeria enalia]